MKFPGNPYFYFVFTYEFSLRLSYLLPLVNVLHYVIVCILL